jgi:hypothetical protein
MGVQRTMKQYLIDDIKKGIAFDVKNQRSEMKQYIKEKLSFAKDLGEEAIEFLSEKLLRKIDEDEEVREAIYKADIDMSIMISSPAIMLMINETIINNFKKNLSKESENK